jgi:citrate synthase
VANTHPYYLTASQAAATLGVTRATLYAYTSRGQLRSEAVPGRSRERRYHREDIERLQDRKEGRRDPAKTAVKGLHWGVPVLESGITLIRGGRFFYRGQDAIELAKRATLEDIAALLWSVEGSDRERLFNQRCPLSRRQQTSMRTLTADPIAAVQAALPIAAARDIGSYDLTPTAVRLTGARILRLVTSIVADTDTSGPAHLLLRAKWALRRPAVADVIRTVLVLCADHELNVSAFTARCAASAGASPYHVVSAALATFRGFRHGGAAEHVLAMLRGAQTPDGVRDIIADRLKSGGGLPGFGHRLYPAGDPRAIALLHLAAASGNEREWKRIRRFLKVSSQVVQDHPNLDFGLAAVTLASGLPDSAPTLLFALGRTVGWIAHAMEEYASGELIRPRARYTGPLPPPEQASHDFVTGRR